MPPCAYSAFAMKALAFFPLAYLAGVQGFAMFAAYAATFPESLVEFRDVLLAVGTKP